VELFKGNLEILYSGGAGIAAHMSPDWRHRIPKAFDRVLKKTFSGHDTSFD
jgi:hypothetical protein